MWANLHISFITSYIFPSELKSFQKHIKEKYLKAKRYSTSTSSSSTERLWTFARLLPITLYAGDCQASFCFQKPIKHMSGVKRVLLKGLEWPSRWACALRLHSMGQWQSITAWHQALPSVCPILELRKELLFSTIQSLASVQRWPG